jgi:hypothetical protein
MGPYIKRLTGNLIGKNNYDDVLRRCQTKQEFINHVKVDLESGDVEEWTPETLGRVMCSFEDGEVLVTHLGKEVHFTGNCGTMLREMVSLALAHLIHDRLVPQDPKNPRRIPPFKR